MKRFGSQNILIKPILVILIIFTFSIFWGSRDILLLSLDTGVDILRSVSAFKGVDNLLVKTDKAKTDLEGTKEHAETLSAERMRIINSKKELNDEIRRLEVEINKISLEIVRLENLIQQAEFKKEIKKLQNELSSVLASVRDLKAEDRGVVEPEPKQQETESAVDQRRGDRTFDKAVDFYVNWLRDKKTIATRNQKAYLCRNQNISQFLAVRDSSAFRKACEITAKQVSEARTDISGNQKSFLCRNRNVAQFLARRPLVPITEVCSN